MENVGAMDVEELTWREQEILGLLADRLTNREIADQLHLAESTVKDYVSNILSKLHVKNRRQAVAEAKRLGLLVEQPPMKTETITNIPVYPSPIIGRVDQLKKIKHLFQEGRRLVTLTGPGGVGKSRLAIQAAEEVADDFEHGCYFVSLAPLKSPNQIIQAIAEALNFPLPTYEDASKQLIRLLQKKQLLLVLDNFEHLLDGSNIIEQILQSVRHVKVLVTSRERLSIQGEVSFQIAGLDCPTSIEDDNLMGFDAIALFTDCSRRTQLSFSPSPVELEKIAAICQIVQGTPLAIELAAAWLRILTVDEIKTEMEQSFDILSRDFRHADNERHSSIRAVFEHSWSMLVAEEQKLFMLVSIFRDGFTRKAAEQVAGATLPTLSRLVDKSVVKYDPETRRFTVHELLRQYGQERLEAHPEKHQSVQGLHAAYFAQLMEESWDHLRGRRQLEAIREINADIENIREAWNHYLSQADAGQIRKFLNSFWLVYWIKGWNLSAVNLFNGAVNALLEIDEDLSINVRAYAMASQAFFLAWVGLAKEGYALAKDALDLLSSSDDLLALYFAYHGLTLPAYYLERLEEEKHANDQMLVIAHTIGDPWLVAFAEFLVSVTLLRSSDYSGAKDFAVSSLDRSEAIEDQMVQALSLNALGHLNKMLGEHEKARKHYLRSLQLARLLGFQWAMGNTIKYLGQLALIRADFDEAEEYFLQSLSIANELGLDRDIANHLLEFARLRAMQDRIPEAVSILGLLLTLPTINQARLGGGQIKEKAQKLLAEFSQEMAPDAFQEYLDRGRKLEIQELVSLSHEIKK